MLAQQDDTESGILDALVVGAGFNGLYQLYHLREQGFSVRVIDAGAELGGVWHWNCYPGARVDSHVPNYQFSFGELWKDWRWTEKFPGRDELCSYFDYLESRLNLKKDIQFNTRVTAAHYDEDRNRWSITTDQHETLHARYLILCTGFAAKSYTPDIKGLAFFEGECHHTGHWPQQGLDFGDKRVGVIGTGASGVQIVQEAGKVASQLTVFQRTPILALPMRQRQLTESDHDTMLATYEEQLRSTRAAGRQYLDITPSNRSGHEFSHEEQQAALARDWAKGGFTFWGNTFSDVLSDPAVNRIVYNFWRDRTRERIHDPAIAGKLAPTEPPHPFGTKRPSLEQWYFEVFNQSNVTLVDTLEDPIQEVVPGGIRTLHGEYPLDVLVMATGFDAYTGGFLQMDIVGRNGLTLREKWADGVRNNLGMCVAGFPNLFMLYGPLSPSALCTGPFCAEIQGAWIVNCLGHLRNTDTKRFEATIIAENAWVDGVKALADTTLFPLADSWYMGANIPGKPRQFLNHAHTPTYMEQCRQCADNGYEGFDLY